MFGTMEDAMMSLFTHGVLGDNLNPAAAEILKYPKGKSEFMGTVLLWLFFIFFAISAMTLLNMLIGVLCEVVTQTAASESENSQVNDLRMCIEDAFELIDTDENGRCSEAEWSRIKFDPEIRKQLDRIFGVLPSEMDQRLDQMQQTLFNTETAKADGLPLEELVQKVIDVRPDKPASTLEIEILRSKVARKEKQFSARLSNVEGILQRVMKMRGLSMSSPGAGEEELQLVQANKDQATQLNLGEIPTPVLFHELKSRDVRYLAPTSSRPGRGTNLAFNQPGPVGAVSYSAIRNVSSNVHGSKAH
jgi:hypothetical protein